MMIQYSEQLQQVMDEEARTTVDAAYQRTLELLESKKDQLETLAALLLEQETAVGSFG